MIPDHLTSSKTALNTALTGCFATSRKYTGIMHPNPGNPDTKQPGQGALRLSHAA
jgi:hypothetical protein